MRHCPGRPVRRRRMSPRGISCSSRSRRSRKRLRARRPWNCKATSPTTPTARTHDTDQRNPRESVEARLPSLDPEPFPVTRRSPAPAAARRIRKGHEMFGDIARFLLNTVFTLFGAALLLRAWMQVVRMPPYNPVSNAVMQATNWIVLPLRKILPGAQDRLGEHPGGVHRVGRVCGADGGAGRRRSDRSCCRRCCSSPC